MASTPAGLVDCWLSANERAFVAINPAALASVCIEDVDLPIRDALNFRRDKTLFIKALIGFCGLR